VNLFQGILELAVTSAKPFNREPFANLVVKLHPVAMIATT
jgi:hypothetical protein